MRTPRVILTALISTAALVAGLVLASAPALAVENHLPLSFSPFGSFSSATGVAVDQATGNVFVADNPRGRCPGV